MEVLGYVLAGPIPNQVLISRWFSRRRGRAMGYAYLGLGLGGVVAPLLINFLAHTLGWRHALQLLGSGNSSVFFLWHFGSRAPLRRNWVWTPDQLELAHTEFLSANFTIRLASRKPPAP